MLSCADLTLSAGQAQVLEAWATLAAAVLAAVASFFAFRAYVKESRIEGRLRDNAEREQASKVAAWFSRTHPDYTGTYVVVVRNASEVPVYQVECAVYDDKTLLSSMPIIGVLGPDVDGLPISVPSAALKRLGELRPGSKKGPQDLLIKVTFVDAAGVLWTRTATGELARG